MNTESGLTETERRKNLRSGIAARFAQILFVFALQAALLFLSAGTFAWIGAWAFLGIYLLSLLINLSFMLRTNPETIAERSRARFEMKWDKVISGLWAMVYFIALPLVAGLDKRFGWTDGLSTPWLVAGGIVLALGLGLGGWAMTVNAYFSTTVRIQSERGQTVCSSGPYRAVRHPGYVGFIFQALGIPVLLGSVWALVPGIAAAAADSTGS